MSTLYLALILGSGYLVVKLMIKLSQQSKCLTNREIKAYIDNTITDDKRRTIRAHISGCDECEERFLDISLGRKRLADEDILDN